MEILINGERIESNIIEREKQNLKRQSPNAKDEEIDKIVQERIISQTILRQAAEKSIDEITEDEINNEFKKIVDGYGGLERFHQQFRLTEAQHPMIKKDISLGMRVDRFIDDLAKDISEPDANAIKDFYDKNQKQFIKPDEIHAAHIVKKPAQGNPQSTYEEMKELRKELLEGANFAEMANKHSDCNDNEGDLGTFPAGKMVEEFDVILFSMNTGEISPIFMTKFGYHIATVYEKIDKKQLKFEECQVVIKKQLRENDRQKALAEWSQKERVTATVQIT